MSIVYVGMDVHKDSYNLCAFVPETAEILGEVRCDAKAENVERFIDSLASKVDDSVTFVTGYEAGVLGYSLHNDLERLGIDCEIMAPSTMLVAATNKIVKNDKRDAKMIAQNLAAKTYKSVYVPDDQDAAVKEFIRLRKSTSKALRVVKQQLQALVLRYGFVYSGKSKWTIMHLKWLKKLVLPDVVQEVLDELMIEYQELTDKLERFDARIEEFSHQERYEQPIKQLRCLKGIDTTIAMTIQVETSDFSRFPSANAYSSYLGLTPSEHSSGNHVQKGSITKEGNRVIRSSLIEAANAITRSNPGYKSKRLKTRQRNVDSSVIAYADKASDRLIRKYRRMLRSGKPRNVAITAIARELACFIWGIENHQISLN